MQSTLGRTDESSSLEHPIPASNVSVQSISISPNFLNLFQKIILITHDIANYGISSAAFIVVFIGFWYFIYQFYKLKRGTRGFIEMSLELIFLLLIALLFPLYVMEVLAKHYGVFSSLTEIFYGTYGILSLIISFILSNLALFFEKALKNVATVFESAAKIMLYAGAMDVLLNLLLSLEGTLAKLIASIVIFTVLLYYFNKDKLSKKSRASDGS